MVFVFASVLVILGIIIITKPRSDTRSLEKLQEIIDRGNPMVTLILKTKKHRYGWKATVYNGERSIFVTSRYHDTEAEAIGMVKRYFCTEWKIRF